MINSDTPNTTRTASREIDDLCLQLTKMRGNTLLVMYYPDDRGQMSEDDMPALDNEFRRHGFRRDTERVKQLDVLIHTLGGHADIGYMLAQILRDYAGSINFLIPFHAASAGTLTCFSADKILFGGYVYLSPIDVSVGNISLMSIDYFMDFAVQCRIKMESQFKTCKINDAESHVESELLLEMVKQISAMDVGKFYRQRTLTAYYAHLLLSTCMFKNHPEAQRIGQDIAGSIYHIC